MRFIIVRPEVQAFGQAMEQVLAENDSKGGWMDETDQYLLERLKDEVKELEQALERPRDHAAIMKEAVDVANFAMMVFDRHREFERFDHLKEVASSRNSMPKSV